MIKTKVITIATTALLALGLVACASTTPPTTESTTDSVLQTPSGESTVTPVDAPAQGEAPAEGEAPAQGMEDPTAIFDDAVSDGIISSDEAEAFLAFMQENGPEEGSDTDIFAEAASEGIITSDQAATLSDTIVIPAQQGGQGGQQAAPQGGAAQQ